MNGQFANDPAELVYDNLTLSGQDPTRPPINGQDVQRLNARWREWLAWMQKGAFDPNSANPVDKANLYAFSKLTRDYRSPSQSQGVTVATTLASALITQYDANPNISGIGSNLAHILVVSVNP